ncbi:hypothetical protein ABK040_010546 [Willaertia magna]
MIPQQNEISSSSPPPFKKIKLPLVNINNTTLITTINNKETSSVTFTCNKKKNILNQFELFKILSFLTNERNSILKMLCLNKTIFNEIFNEESLQENMNHFILRNENIFVTIILSIFFNYKLNLFVNNEIYNNLQLLKQQINKNNVLNVLQNYLNNNNLYNNTVTKNVEFFCNDGKQRFSNDTMIYREEDDDDFLQFEFNLQKKQWSTWLNELSNKENSEMLQNIQHELNCKIFDKVNFAKVKKSDLLNFHICITKYKIGENLEFNYNALGTYKNSFNWTLKFKVYNNNNTQLINNNIFTLIESDTNITINLQNLHKIKTILQINNNLVSNELLIEAILISSPLWNILKFIQQNFNITKISFHNNKTIKTVFNDEDINYNEIKDNKVIDRMTEKGKINEFTILNLPVELLNYICNYLFYLKDGLSFCLTSKEIYYAIYYNNNLFIPNKIMINNFIPLIMTTIYNKFKQQKVIINNDNITKEDRNNFYFNLSFSNYIGDLNQFNNYYFKLFLTILKRIEHFIGYVDSLQRYIYVKHFEFNKFHKEINDKYISQQLNDKIFKKLIYQSSQINALDDQWCYKTLYNINNCIFLQQKVYFDNNDPIMYWNIKIKSENNKFLEFKEIYELENHLLEEIDEKQLRKYLDLEDERVTIDLICKCLKYCSPFKFEFIEYCEKHNMY